MNALRFQSSRANLLKVSLVALAAMLAALLFAVVKVEPSQASFPGQNGMIAFSSTLSTGENVDNPEGDYEIFTISPSGTNLTQLTHNATGDFSLEWSPDGTKIAYQGYDGNDYEIFTIPATGGESAQVTDNVEDDAQPTWSPDGTKIAYSGLGLINEEIPDWKVRNIYTIPSSGGTPTAVVRSTADHPHYGPYSPDWSPDGTKIVYSWNYEGGEGYSRLQVIDLAIGQEHTTLTQESPVWSEGSPEWSPDGSRIAFMGYTPEPEVQEIYVVGAGGGMPVALTDTPTRWEDTPAWSPDGSRIAFSAWDSDDPPGPDHAIYTLPAGGGTPTNLTNGLDIGSILGLDWQPLPTNTAPTITSLRPAPGSRTTDRTPTIAATVTDQQTNLAKSNITLVLDGATIPPTAFSYNQSTDRMSYTPQKKKLSHGKHTVKVGARDDAGLSTTKSWGFEIVHP